MPTIAEILASQPGTARGILSQTVAGISPEAPAGGPSLTPEDIIAERTPEAVGLIEAGREEALRLSRLGAEQIDPLRRFGDLAAFREQQAILGLSGEEAQRQAIGGIPVSEAQQEMQRRQRETQIRQAAARGDISGASLMGAQQLAGTQQLQNIQGRLAQLEPLARIARGTRSTLSQQAEAARARQAQIIGGAGTQLANIRLGAAAPQIAGMQQQAQLSGLAGISAAQQQAQQQAQLAGLAGQVLPQFFAPTAASTGATAGLGAGLGL